MDYRVIELKATIQKVSPENHFHIVFDLPRIENTKYPNGYQVKHIMIQFEPLTDDLNFISVSYQASGITLDKYVTNDPRGYYTLWKICDHLKKHQVYAFDVPFFSNMPLSKHAPPISVSFHACVTNDDSCDTQEGAVKDCKLTVFVSSLSEFEKTQNTQLMEFITREFHWQLAPG